MPKAAETIQGIPRARALLRKGNFVKAAEAAVEAVRSGDVRGRLVLAIDALSLGDLDATTSHARWLIVNDVLREAASKVYWAAARRSGKLTALRDFAEVITPVYPLKAARLRTYIGLADQNVDTLCMARGYATDLPFLPKFPIPVVEACVETKVGRVRMLKLIVDSGAESLVISHNVAADIGISRVLSHRGVFAGGKTAAVSRAILPQLRLGEISFSNIPTDVHAEISQLRNDCFVDGILGAKILASGHAIWDFQRQRLLLSPSSRKTSYSLTVAARVLGSHILIIPAKLTNKIMGWFFVDTGGTFGVAIDGAAWKSLHGDGGDQTSFGSGGGGQIEYTIASGDCLEIGDLCFEDFVTVGHVFPERLKKDTFVNVRGIISHEIIAKMALFSINYNQASICFRYRGR